MHWQVQSYLDLIFHMIAIDSILLHREIIAKRNHIYHVIFV